MATDFTITIDACEPDDFKYGIITVNAGAGSSDTKTVWANNTCGKCPYTEEELNKTCPNQEDREKIYAYDSINDYEADNEQEKIAHQQSILNSGGSVAWLYDCERCIQCKDDLGGGSLSASMYAKTCEPCGGETNRSLCNGGGRVNGSGVRSKPFSRQCYKVNDVYAKVTATFDNWGYVKDAYGPVRTSSCSNEGSAACEICSKTEEIGPLNAVSAGTDINPSNEDMLEVGVNGWSINSPHGGPVSINATISFYFKPKPKN